MSDIKMSEELSIPWSSIDYQNRIVNRFGDFVVFSDMHQSERDALCLAINNHDKLAEQNKRLIELVEEMASFKDEQGKSYYLGKLNQIKGGE